MAINPLGNGIDPLASIRAMEQARRVVDPLAEVSRLREQTKPVDPLASIRAMEQARRVVDPLAEVSRLREQTKPVDPLASVGAMEQARRVVDPLGEYRRIMSDFSRLVGAPPPSPEEEAATSARQPVELALPPFSPALILTLLSVAWTCGWLIARGADAQVFGDLLFEAAGLAAYFYEQSRRNDS
jgi:hypothetical protein